MSEWVKSESSTGTQMVRARLHRFDSFFNLSKYNGWKIVSNIFFCFASSLSLVPHSTSAVLVSSSSLGAACVCVDIECSRVLKSRVPHCLLRRSFINWVHFALDKWEECVFACGCVFYSPFAIQYPVFFYISFSLRLLFTPIFEHRVWCGCWRWLGPLEEISISR